MSFNSKHRKIKRESLGDSSYKRDEAQHSGQIGLKVWKRYRSNRGLKFLFERTNNKIIESAQSDSEFDIKEQKLLEIGCGMGDFLREAADVFSQVYGVDISEDMISVAYDILPKNAHVSVIDGEQLPFKDNFFNVVVMKGVVHHLGKPDLVFREVKRVLQKNGRLVIFEGNPSSWYRCFILKVADLLRIEHETSFFPHLSAEQISNLLIKFGLQPKTKKVSGLFAPLGLSGIGGKRLWCVLNTVEDFFEKYMPLFSWYNLIVADKV